MPYQVQALPFPLVANVQITATALATAQSLGALPATITYAGAGTSVSNVNVDYWIIQEISVANTDTATSHEVKIYDVPTGSAAASNLIAVIPVAADRSVNPGFSTVIPAGHTLYAVADAANFVNVKISGSALVG